MNATVADLDETTLIQIAASDENVGDDDERARVISARMQCTIKGIPYPRPALTLRELMAIVDEGVNPQVAIANRAPSAPSQPTTTDPKTEHPGPVLTERPGR